MQVNNMSLSQAAVQMMQGQQGGLQNLQTMLGDEGFGMILQQLVMGQNGAGLEGILAELQNGEMDSDKKGTDLASMMMAEFLNTPAQWMMLQMEAQTNPMNNLQGGNAQQLLSLLQNAQVQEASTMLTPDQQKQVDEMQQQANAFQQTLAALNATAGGNKGADGTSLLQGQTSFLQSIAEAKKQLGDSPEQGGKQQETVLMDVDQLQQQVDAGRFGAGSVNKTEAEALDANNLLEQVKTGVKQNVSLGKNEFEISLKPEGLGRITVKLTESDGKMVLNLITSSNQVAKLLNSELTGLRESLSPYHVEVHEAVSQGDGAQQGNLNGQTFADQQQKQQYEEQTSHATASGYMGDTMDGFEDEVVQQSLASELNYYI